MQATIVRKVIIFSNTQLTLQWLGQVICWSYSILKAQYDPMKFFVRNTNTKKRPLSQQNHPIHQSTLKNAEWKNFYR